MMINKNRFRVSNDKKVLHKIGKRWVTVSALTLALLGGGALAGSVTTHAASNQPQAQSVAAKPSTSAKAAAPSSAQSQSTSNAKPSSANSSAGNIESQAGQVHKGLMLDATQHSDNDMNTLSIGRTPEDRAKQAKAWNFTQHGINHDDYDNYKMPSQNKKKLNLKATSPLDKLGEDQKSDNIFSGKVIKQGSDYTKYSDGAVAINFGWSDETPTPSDINNATDIQVDTSYSDYDMDGKNGADLDKLPNAQYLDLSTTSGSDGGFLSNNGMLIDHIPTLKKLKLIQTYV